MSGKYDRAIEELKRVRSALLDQADVWLNHDLDEIDEGIAAFERLNERNGMTDLMKGVS